MNAAEKSNAQLPMQSQRAVEDFLEQLLREKGAHGIVKEQQTNNDVLFATAKTFLENAIVRCVVGTTNPTSEGGGGGGDLNKDDDEAIVHALRRVKAVLNERIRGRTNADVILLNAVDRSIVVAKEELIAFREEKKKKQTTTTKKGLNNNESSFKVYKQNVISAIREMIASDVDQAKRAIGEYAFATGWWRTF